MANLRAVVEIVVLVFASIIGSNQYVANVELAIVNMAGKRVDAKIVVLAFANMANKNNIVMAVAQLVVKDTTRTARTAND